VWLPLTQTESIVGSPNVATDSEPDRGLVWLQPFPGPAHGLAVDHYALTLNRHLDDLGKSNRTMGTRGDVQGSHRRGPGVRPPPPGTPVVSQDRTRPPRSAVDRLPALLQFCDVPPPGHVTELQKVLSPPSSAGTAVLVLVMARALVRLRGLMGARVGRWLLALVARRARGGPPRR
jgi:hypothetical protein